jgi:hypothetical protein
MLNLMVRVVFAAAIISGLSAATQQIGTLKTQQAGSVKAENGVIIAWTPKASDASTNQIEIFDMKGQPLVSLNILRATPEAKRVSIYDVSALPNKVIAVAAVYGRGDGGPAVDTLQYFSFRAELLSFFLLQPSREIARLAVDKDENVWALSRSSAGGDTSLLPMVVEYSRGGQVLKQMLRRSDFPGNEQILRQDPGVGVVQFGYSEGWLWFWLPGSTDIVVADTTNGTVLRNKTGLPGAIGKAVPMRMIREESGRLVAETEALDHSTAHTLYQWSPKTSSWTAFEPTGCGVGYGLVGMNGQQQIYIEASDGAGQEICAFTPAS